MYPERASEFSERLCKSLDKLATLFSIFANDILFCDFWNDAPELATGRATATLGLGMVGRYGGLFVGSATAHG